MRLTALLSHISFENISRCPSALETVDVGRIEYDSRKADAGTLFVCLVGARADGHDYAMHAYRGGCRAFLVSREVELPADAIVVRTADTRAALAVISADFYGRPADHLHLIGITGTKGKTTTALMIAAILNGAGKSCAYIGSNGVTIRDRHIETVNTTPESRDLHSYFASMVECGVEYAVIEVSSQALAHCRVSGIVFETVIFTNFSPDHIGAKDGEHPDLADYMQSKAKLFTDYGAKHVIRNIDDPMWREITGAAGGEILSCAVRADASFSAWDIRPYRGRTTLGVEFDCVYGDSTTRVTLRTPGEFSVYNALSAIAAASVYGVSVERAAEILAVTSVQGRFEIVEGLAERTFILDYAHNGLSLTSALNALRAYNPRRLICLFGSVGGRTKGRRAELGTAASALADYCIVTSDNPDYESPRAIMDDIMQYFDRRCPHILIPDRTEAVQYAVRMSEPGDILLFAGKGHETYQLICGEKVPFSERRLIEETSEAMLAEAENSAEKERV